MILGRYTDGRTDRTGCKVGEAKCNKCQSLVVAPTRQATPEIVHDQRLSNEAEQAKLSREHYLCGDESTERMDVDAEYRSLQLFRPISKRPDVTGYGSYDREVNIMRIQEF